ncbi:hypothetical protein HRbin15_01662 [bacterium HR15]|nr:hypothetical protein HRbin15_01662 [bacterium HR15]
MRQNGFTLIELLMVIAVLALLMAILLPVFWRARRSAHNPVCASHLRQLSFATLAYAQDYEECFALGFYRVGTGNHALLATLWGLHRPYIKTDAIHQCPLEPQPIPLTALRSRIDMPLAEPSVEVALVPNWCLFVNEITFPDTPAVSLAQMSYPAQTVVWFDGYLTRGNETRFEPASSVAARHGEPVEPLYEQLIRQSRVDRVLAAALDGHVQNLPAWLRPDVQREGNSFIQYLARPIALDGRSVPVWFIQGGVYHGKSSFMGWPSRYDPDTGRMLLRCYHRTFYCDEW